MDIAGRLVQLEEIVRDAKSMPLSSSALVNREEVLELLREMQESLPEEIKQARWIVKDREELLTKARADAEKIVEGAREEQLRMSRKEAIVTRANEEAERVLNEAGEQSRTLRGEAEDYADQKLAQLEIGLRRLLEDTQSAVRALTKTLDQVEIGRDRLRAPATAAEQEFAPVDQEAQVQFYDEEEQR
jgi:vacuolar-type H+-ATPase subunit H